MIIFGYKTRLTKSNEKDKTELSCPSCLEKSCLGKLELHDLKRWFTLYFIPIFPFGTIESYYKCHLCGETYKKEIKEIMEKNKKEKKKFQDDTKITLAKALAACMTYMAKVDGKISKEEQKEIDILLKNMPNSKAEIKKVIDKVKKTKDKKYVFEVLKEARKFLTADGVMFIIGVLARMLMADGKIDKREEKLMKEFLKACDLPEELYVVIIESVKNRETKK
ncbi:MAG: TerB family tellurite resistance protein [Nanoarchaeota archaeon]|nr:TerB family tellurite resistance protein [Nanoarchaeota archaeon]